MSERFDVMLSTTKTEYSLVFESDESITLVFIVSMRQKNLLAFSGEPFVELVRFSMKY